MEPEILNSMIEIGTATKNGNVPDGIDEEKKWAHHGLFDLMRQK